MSQSENEDLKSIFPAQGRGLGMVGDRVTFSESHFALLSSILFTGRVKC